MTNPVQIHFCQNIVQIWCDDANLRQQLEQYFRHCLAKSKADVSVVAQYRLVQAPSNQWEVWCDDQLVHIAPETFFVFIYITHDIMAKLTVACNKRLVFHAAGVALDDRGVILCAASDSGKSTLAAWLLGSGFDFLTDEMIAIGSDDTTIQGLPFPIVLKSGSEFVWKRWGNEAQTKNIQYFNGAMWVDAEAFRPNAVIASTTARLLIFPRYEARATFQVQPLSKARAVFRLLPRVINFTTFADRGQEIATSFVKRIPAYSLVYSDINEATAWIRKTLTENDKTG